MKKFFIILVVYALAIQLSYQQFKPVRKTTGPYGNSAGTSFNFNMGSDMFNTLPGFMVVSHGSSGINSIAFTYYRQIGQTVKQGGTRSGAVTETQLGRIVRASVCTGQRSGTTVIIGLKFYYENGMSNYFHGNTSSVTSFKCVSATPTTPGYYLQYLSGRYGTYINQLKFYWVSNFEQEKACYNDPDCGQELDYCPSDYCCYQKRLDDDGVWQNSAFCA